MHRRPILSDPNANYSLIQWFFPSLKQVQLAFGDRNQADADADQTRLAAIEVLMRPA